MTPRLSLRIALSAAAAVLAMFAATASQARRPADDRPAVVRPLSQADIDAGLEQSIVDVINRARADPPAFAQTFLDYNGKLGRMSGNEAYVAYQYMRGAAQAPALSIDHRLTQAALSQVNYLGPNGLLTHLGADGSTPGGRIRLAGFTSTMTAEELSFGSNRPEQVVNQLILDLGNPAGPHRRDLFNPVFTHVGVACGPHRSQRYVCVIDLSNAPFGTAPTPHASIPSASPTLVDLPDPFAGLSLDQSVLGGTRPFFPVFCPGRTAGLSPWRPEPLSSDLELIEAVNRQEHLGATAAIEGSDQAWTGPGGTTLQPFGACGGWIRARLIGGDYGRFDPAPAPYTSPEEDPPIDPSTPM